MADPEIRETDAQQDQESRQELRQLIREEMADLSKQTSSDLPLKNLITSVAALEQRLERLEQAVTTSEEDGEQSRSDELRQMNDYAVQLFYMDQLDEAVQLLKEAAKKFPGCLEIWNNLAMVYCAMERSEDAAQAFSHALDLDPKTVEILNNQGVLALLDAKADKALEMLEEAHRRAPHELDILMNLAHAHVALNQPAKAIRTWKIIISIDPQHEVATQQLRQYYQ